MATYTPQRNALSLNLWQWLTNELTVPASDRVLFGRGYFDLNPQGYYAGSVKKNLTASDTILTNPWGVGAETGSATLLSRAPKIYLDPGQSIDFRTGRLSDPNLHASTALRLNNAVQARQVKEAGLTQASQTSARGQQSVLATLDQLYFANQTTSVKTSAELSGIAEAKQTGYTAPSRTTLLGNKAKPVAAPVLTGLAALLKR